MEGGLPCKFLIPEDFFAESRQQRSYGSQTAALAFCNGSEVIMLHELKLHANSGEGTWIPASCFDRSMKIQFSFPHDYPGTSTWPQIAPGYTSGHEEPACPRSVHGVSPPHDGLQKVSAAASAASPAADSGGSLADRLKAVQNRRPRRMRPSSMAAFPANGSPLSIPLQQGLEIATVDPDRARNHPSEDPLSTLVVALNASQILVHHRNNPQADKERHMASSTMNKAFRASRRLKWTIANRSVTS